MTNDRSAEPNRRSSRVLAGLLVLGPAVLAGWAYQSLRVASGSVQTAEADLSECRQLIADIERLRQRPRVAALDEETPSAITNRVSQSIRAASLPTTALIRVEPQAPVRVNRTQYMLRSTRIELSDVSLEQLVRFADALGDVEQGMIVRSLILTEPRSQASSPERWMAEITLTQSIFSPTIR